MRCCCGDEKNSSFWFCTPCWRAVSQDKTLQAALWRRSFNPTSYLEYERAKAVVQRCLMGDRKEGA
jgi:hypothetical protein